MLPYIFRASLIFTWQILICAFKQKVIKNNKGLEICYSQALKKIGRKILIVNPIRMFLVEIPGFHKVMIVLLFGKTLKIFKETFQLDRLLKFCNQFSGELDRNKSLTLC